MLISKIKNLKDNLNASGKIVVSSIICFFILTIISLILGASSNLRYLESFRIIFGSVYVLFLPGFVISYIFFPKTKEFDSGSERNKEHENEKGSIDWIERIALSFALSIAVVPLAVFYLNLIGVRINTVNSFFTILGIIVISLGVLYAKSRREIIRE